MKQILPRPVTSHNLVAPSFLPTTFLINDQEIFVDEDGFINLRLLWKASDKDPNKKPYEWLRWPSTKEFISKLESTLYEEGSVLHALRTKKGSQGGTYGHWQIALAYAKCLSPELQLNSLCQPLQSYCR